MENSVFKGQKSSWKYIRTLGEGISGQALIVEDVKNGKQAVLKQPAPGGFPTDLQRQAKQIQNEGFILKSLSSVEFSELHLKARAVKLLDVSQVSVAGVSNFRGEREEYFIVLEKASGIDLKTLFQANKSLELAKLDYKELSPQERNFVREINRNGFPASFLAKLIYALLGFLRESHHCQSDIDSKAAYGIVWNDVKPEHVFWNEDEQEFTIIDWGNSQYLDINRVSADGYSPTGDMLQFFDEIGKFLLDVSPSWCRSVNWPMAPTRENALEKSGRLFGTVREIVKEEYRHLNELDRETQRIYSHSDPDEKDFNRLIEIYTGRGKRVLVPTEFVEKVLLRLLCDTDFDAYRRVLHNKYVSLSKVDAKWKMLLLIAMHASKQSNPIKRYMLDALRKHGAVNNWSELLWKLGYWSLHDKDQTWWEDVSTAIRQLHFGDNFPPSPLRYLRSLIPSQQNKSNLNKLISDWEANAAEGLNAELVWFEYPSDVLADIKKVLTPSQFQDFENAIFQPKAAIDGFLGVWNSMSFSAIPALCRSILLYDPDWRKIIWYTPEEKPLQSLQMWLSALKDGPGNRDIQQFAKDLLNDQNRFGPIIDKTPWLKSIRTILEFLSRGQTPTDYPQSPELDLGEYFSWLKLAEDPIREWEQIEKVVENFYLALQENDLSRANESLAQMGNWGGNYRLFMQQFQMLTRQWYQNTETRLDQQATFHPKDLWKDNAQKVLKMLTRSRVALQSEGFEAASGILQGYDDWNLVVEFKKIYNCDDIEFIKWIFKNKKFFALSDDVEKYKQKLNSSAQAGKINWSDFIEGLGKISSAHNIWGQSTSGKNLEKSLKKIKRDIDSASTDWLNWQHNLGESLLAILLKESWEYWAIVQSIEPRKGIVQKCLDGCKYFLGRKKPGYQDSDWQQAERWMMSLVNLENELGDEGLGEGWYQSFLRAKNAYRQQGEHGENLVTTINIDDSHPLYVWLKNSHRKGYLPFVPKIIFATTLAICLLCVGASLNSQEMFDWGKFIQRNWPDVQAVPTSIPTSTKVPKKQTEPPPRTPAIEKISTPTSTKEDVLVPITPPGSLDYADLAAKLEDIWAEENLDRAKKELDRFVRINNLPFLPNLNTIDEQREYINWLRVTFALCSVNTPVNIPNADEWQLFLKHHFGKYKQAEQYYQQCIDNFNRQLTILSLPTKNLLDNNWPTNPNKNVVNGKKYGYSLYVNDKAYRLYSNINSTRIEIEDFSLPSAYLLPSDWQGVYQTELEFKHIGDDCKRYSDNVNYFYFIEYRMLHKGQYLSTLRLLQLAQEGGLAFEASFVDTPRSTVEKMVVDGKLLLRDDRYRLTIVTLHVKNIVVWKILQNNGTTIFLSGLVENEFLYNSPNFELELGAANCAPQISKWLFYGGD